MLSTFEGRLGVQERRGPPDASIHAATLDSRVVEPGTLFGAIPGTQVDGHRFIPSALDSGAAAVILRDWPEAWPEDVVGLRVDDPRRSMAIAASALEGEPASSMLTFGITGTNGKTSTVAILASILRAAGLKTATMGTTGFDWDGPEGLRHADSIHTTPDGPELYRWLARFRDDGVQAVAMELSSHALEQGRAAGLALNVAAWTNLSRDHLDFHGTMEAYAAAKGRLFTEWLPRWGKAGYAAVFNDDDDFVGRWAWDGGRALRVSRRHRAAHVTPLDRLRVDRDGISGRIEVGTHEAMLQSSLLGWHNAENLLMAGACAHAAGIDTAAIERGWAKAEGAPGRLERVDGPGPLVLVDYAHTPDALHRVLVTLRRLTTGKLHVVFGAGGDRDTGKRPLMAQVAASDADDIILTTDNPRTESPEAILDGIQAGLVGIDVPWLRIIDRAEAIAVAIGRAADEDTVLIAGKGHETYQEVDGVRHPFDDRVQARAALEARA